MTSTRLGAAARRATGRLAHDWRRRRLSAAARSGRPEQRLRRRSPCCRKPPDLIVLAL